MVLNYILVGCSCKLRWLSSVFTRLAADLVSKSSRKMPAPRCTISKRLCYTTVTNLQTSNSRDSSTAGFVAAFFPLFFWVTLHGSFLPVPARRFPRQRKSRGLWFSPLSPANEHPGLETESALSQLEWTTLNSNCKLTWKIEERTCWTDLKLNVVIIFYKLTTLEELQWESLRLT